jgi:hypothetical protein
MMTSEAPKTKIPIPHLAEIIHRLEAGGTMLPDTPENLMQIIGLYKGYTVPMDFLLWSLLYIYEQVF